jgi:hypothetical protein
MIALATALMLAQAPAWPPCDDPDLAPRTDCVLATGDSLGWLIGFDYSPDGGEAREVEIIVTGADGAPFQSFELDLERGFRAPVLSDLDGDGLDDVLAPLSTGLVNSDWALFFGDFTGMLEAGARVNGHTVEAFEAGLFAVHARSNAAQHYVTVYRREDVSLIQQAVVSVEFEEGGATCRLVRADDDRGEEFYCNAALSD